MKQRTAIILSIAITAFLLVLTGAVAALATDSPQPSSAAEATLDPALENQLKAREAEYQAALEEANSRLEEAYQTIEAMQQQTPTEAPETTIYPVSPELAVGLALNLSPGSELEKWPELVNFRGTAAYEIILDRGPVYISATDAILLYNGTQTKATGSAANRYDDDEHDDENEHEYEEEDEHEDD